MHPLLILVLVFDLLIAVSSVLNLVNMMRVNLMVEERRAEALTVQRVRVQKAAAGKGGMEHPSNLGVQLARERRDDETAVGIPAPEHLLELVLIVVERDAQLDAGMLRPLPPPWCPSSPPVCWSSATSPPTCAAALSRCGSRRPHSRLCWRLSSASEQALPPSRLFGTRLFLCGPLTHRLPGRGTMPGKYKYKGRQLWNY